MVNISVNIKAASPDAALDLLKSALHTIQSNDWSAHFENEVSIVGPGGETSTVIVHNEEEYHGVKVSCCG